MDINIFANFQDNKIIFTLSLPIDFIDIDEENYRKLDDKIIYICDDTTIDYDDFNKKVETLKKIIKKCFSIDDEINIKNNIIYTEDNTNAYEFIKQNKDLEIIFRVSDFKEIIEVLKDEDYPNLKISFKNSDDNISYKEFYNMYKKLNEIVEFINHYNLSPLEKVMFVYDIVKANEYKKENKNDSYGTSRNLNEIINNDKIVCVGYANLIDFLLKNLGVKSNTIILGYQDKNVQHERNYIYLKDDKYNIDGMFFLDATWDSKKNDSYIDNYFYFLKPLNFFRRVKPSEYVVRPSKFKVLEKNKVELISYIKTLEGMEAISFSITLSQLINEYNPNVGVILGAGNSSNEKMVHMTTEILDKYCKRISEETFKNALYRVRKIEYITGILKQEVNEEYIDSVCDRYYGNSTEVKLLKALNMYDRPTLAKDLENSKAETAEKDMLRMRLLRAIKEKIDDKPQNDYIKKM